MMRAVVVASPGKVQVAEMPRPEPVEGQILIQAAACGVCGTDVHILKGEYLGDYPVIPGHEFAGEVVEVGPGVTAFKRHDRVAVEPNLSCGRCRFCRLNEQNFCESWRAIGVTLPGAMAEYVAVPASAAFDIGDLSYEAAAFMEPLSCVLHGMHKLDVRYGESVLVIGAGPIGMLLMQVALDCGAAQVVVADRIASRLDLAKELGASHAVNTGDGFGPVEDYASGGYDAVIDATGAPAVIEQTIDLARHGGRILLFGVAPNDAEMRIKPFDVFRKGLQIVSSYTSLRNSQQALDLLDGGRIDVSRLVSHRLPLDGFADAVGLLAEPEGAMKIQINPGM
jgi:2-desacetyl-2-hydroxyethyl bacteriochlorophyllide A dehydrogenase